LATFRHFSAFHCAVVLASTVDILAAYFAAVRGNVDLSTYCAVILAFFFIHYTFDILAVCFCGIYGTVSLFLASF